MITIEEIRAAEAERTRIDNALATIGQQIYEIREGSKLDGVYVFDHYYIGKFEHPSFYDMEGPDWGKGTPFISINFYWGRVGETITVTLPQEWLTQDYCQLERDRVAEQKAAQAAQDELDRQQRKIARENSERETYERLKKKFEKEI